ncbi:MAG: CPBP family intramembrane metalloprotease [Clostridia bacterium]|nr:CPBP family intramembrane metalloprotease [Clostridia bacterium]
MFKTLTEPKKSGILFSLFILFYLIFTVIVSVVLVMFSASDFFLNVFSPLCYVLAVVCVFIFNRKLFDSKITFFKSEKTSFKYYILALLLAVGMLFSLGSINSIFTDYLSKFGVQVPSISLDLSSPTKYIISIISIALLPAFFEELFFRKILIGSLKIDSIKLSILVGLLFSLYHVSLSQFIYQFVYGFLLTILALKGRSFYPCVLAHFINNFLVLSLEYFKININFYSWQVIVVGFVFLFSFIIGIFFNDKEEEKKESLLEFFSYSLIGIAICILLIISGVKAC